MNLERMRLCREIVASIPEQKLNLDCWASVDGFTRPLTKPSPSTCGTIACAGGWISMDPRVNELGLRLEPDTLGRWCPNYKFARATGPALALGFTAFHIFLDIPPEDSRALFDGLVTEEESALNKSDKQIWLARFDKYMEGK